MPEKPDGDARDRIAAALAATEVPIGRQNLVDIALSGLDDDEREAWVEKLRDESIPAQHIHRAMRLMGLKVGNTDSSVKTWRTTHLLG